MDMDFADCLIGVLVFSNYFVILPAGSVTK